MAILYSKIFPAEFFIVGFFVFIVSIIKEIVFYGDYAFDYYRGHSLFLTCKYNKGERRILNNILPRKGFNRKIKFGTATITKHIFQPNSGPVIPANNCPPPIPNPTTKPKYPVAADRILDGK